jgi:hypothetical protein
VTNIISVRSEIVGGAYTVANDQLMEDIPSRKVKLYHANYYRGLAHRST